MITPAFRSYRRPTRSLLGRIHSPLERNVERTEYSIPAQEHRSVDSIHVAWREVGDLIRHAIGTYNRVTQNTTPNHVESQRKTSEQQATKA